MKRVLIMPGLCFLSVLILLTCRQISHKPIDLSKVSVYWELHTPSDASFVLKNEGKEILDATNWKLYFNMAPRPIQSIDSSKDVRMEHINGDYYRLVPNKNFKLEPGSSVQIAYYFSWVLLKETDAPRGLYFVSTDKKGREEGIYPVNNFKMMPLEPALDNNSDNASLYPPHSPQYQYAQNLKINVLPEVEWQAIIPQPVKMSKNNQLFRIDSTLTVISDPALEDVTGYLIHRFQQDYGLCLNYKKANETVGKALRLKLDTLKINNEVKESYRLEITSQGIKIIGSDAAGVFYGIQTLLSMIPVECLGKKNDEIMLKGAKIEDAPRFAYRGLHIDVCRHFQSKSEILKVLDLMATYKINKLHLYLTEDEGWRLEIKALPELTQVGSRRGHCPDENMMLNPAYGSGPNPDSVQAYGSGYYTQEDFMEILKYANERFIQVIPSINFPGHARAAIKAMEVRYKKLRKQGKWKEAREYRLMEPKDTSDYLSAQFYTDNVVDISLESVYHFYETVISELSDMYKKAGVPFTFIHTGGDEVPSGAWTGIPRCADIMQKMNISESKDLQAFFTGRMLPIVKKFNLEAGGWEEIALKQGINGHKEVNAEFVEQNVVPYVWNNLVGDEDLSYKLANAGYKVVLCGVTNFYLDMAYNSDPYEPGLYWGGYNDEYDPWVAAPSNLTGTSSKMVRLNIESTKNILGLQAQLWGETVIGSDMLEYYLLPKLISFSERAWAAEPAWEEMPESKRKELFMNEQWNSFINAVSQRELPRLSKLFGGFNYRVPPPGAVIEDGMLKVNCQYPGIKIYYTTDGSVPNENSMEYKAPTEIKKSVRLIAIDKNGKKSRIVSIINN